MKVWEETWEVTDGGAVLEVKGTYASIAEHMTGQGPEDKARLVLAAQAPAMARLLLRLAEGVTFSCAGGIAGGCPSCLDDGGKDHLEGCELVAVLRDAGVLP